MGPGARAGNETGPLSNFLERGPKGMGYVPGGLRLGVPPP